MGEERVSGLKYTFLMENVFQKHLRILKATSICGS